ncbi:MAG: hypothetical protein KBC96_00615 [Armatimonadetes bacterium]|nr:hypothetical protein [Armatimonadota bacterium]
MQIRLRTAVFVVSLALAMLSVARAQIIPYDPETMSFAVTLEQAITSARDWIGDTDLSLVLEGVSVELDSGAYYALESEDGVHYFWVDCQTGEVRLWTDRVASRDYTAKLDWPESSQMPIAQLNSVVRGFLIAHYPQFELLNLQPLNADNASTVYVQQLPSGAYYCLNNAGCSIDKWSGVVVSYIGRHGPPPTVPTSAVVTAQQAEQLAIDYGWTIPIIDCDSEDPHNPVLPQSGFVLDNHGLWIIGDDLGMQRLSWAISVVLHASSEYTATAYCDELNDPVVPGLASGTEVSVLVDAITGEVFATDAGGYAGASLRKLSREDAAGITNQRRSSSSAQAAPRQEGGIEVDGIALDLKYPVLRVDGAGYLYARYLPLLYGGSIHWDKGKAELTIAERSIKLRPKSRLLQINGQSIILDRPIMLIADRIYVPYQAIPHLCQASVVWADNERVLHVRSDGLGLKPGSRLWIAKSIRERPCVVDAK